jgi:hypothetical protein
MGVKEYKARCAEIGKEPDDNEMEEYAERFAGPEPKLEDF